MTEKSISQLISLDEARSKGLKRYFTGKPCKHGHVSERQTINSDCIECKRIRNADANANNSNTILKNKYRSRKWYDNNKNKCLARSRKWYLDNKAHALENSKHYRILHSDQTKIWRRNHYIKNKEATLICNKHWRLKNPHVVATLKRNERARKRNASGYHTSDEILTLYELQNGKCANPFCKKELKDGYHGDHIVALINGGSNWISNIQLLCPKCNLSKGKKDYKTFLKDYIASNHHVGGRNPITNALIPRLVKRR